MKNLAPISISTYSRIEHLKQTVQALQMNALAKESVLYIFSDAPREGDEEVVGQIRDYIDTISGFKEVIIIKQKTNNYAKNMKESSSIPLARFGKVIRMEDDIMTSSHFLTYMNNALELYKDDKSIFAISAYTPAVDLSEILAKDVFLSKDFNAWGYATWSDRGFLEAREKTDYYTAIMYHKELHKKIRKLHPMMMDTLHLIEQGKNNAVDYKLSANLHLKDSYTVKPIKSLTKNIGFDGSGVGGAVISRFDTKLDEAFCPVVRDDIDYNPAIDEIIFRNYFNEKLTKKVIIKIKNKMRIHVNEKLYRGLKKWIKKYM